MADTPLIPDEDDVKNLTDYLNIQKQITDTLKTNLEIMDKIGHIDRNLESELKKKVDTQREYLKEVDDFNGSLQKQIEIAKTLDGVKRTEANHAIESMKDQIKYNRDLVSSIQEQITYQIRKAEELYKEENKYQDLVKSLFPKVTGFQNTQLQKHKEIYDMLNKSTFKFKEHAGLLAGILVIAAHAFEVFQKFDKTAAQFRMEMGMTRTAAEGIRSSSEKIAIDFMQIGVTIEGVNKATMALEDSMGSVNIITDGLRKNVSILSAQLGVGEENSAGFMRNMAAAANSTMESQTNMAYTAAYMAQAAGVPLNLVMGDIATMSAAALNIMGRFPNQLLRSSIELRRMGTNLNTAAEGASHLLDFTTSVQDEMEASVLLGKAINLQRIRELTYAGHLVEANQAIVDLARKNNFIHLDFFQKQAMAKALGKSVGELTKMVQVQEEWNSARRSSDPELKKMVANYDAMRNASKQTVQSETEKLKLMVQQKANQDRLTSISNKWNQILTQASAVLLPVIDALLSAVIPAMDIAKGFFAWSVGLKSVFKIITVLGDKFAFFEKIFYGIVGIGVKLEGIFGRFFGIFSKIGKYITPLFRFLGIFGGTFGKAIPILGEVIMALQFIWNLGKRLIAIWNDPNMSIGTKILEGLKAVGYAVYDTLIQPFVDAWKWIKGLWGGNSPSKIGLSILTGIVSIGAMMYDALTSPFRHALAWIADKIPGMGKVAEKLRGGVQGLMNKPLETRAAAAYIPAVQVTPNGTRIASNPDAKPTTTATAAAESDSSDKTLTAILNAINTLNANMEAGKIGIHMDGQLLSATLARQTEFRGGYGVNKM